MKKVEVKWIDAQSSLDVAELEELKDYQPLITKSCGYLVHEDKNKVVLCFMLFGDGLAKHWQVIPKKMVERIRYFK